MAKLTALQTLAASQVTTELDLETQATIIGLAKNSSRGVHYFEVKTAEQIKAALVADKLVGEDTPLFEVTKGGDARPIGDWLKLEEETTELKTI